MAQFLIAFVSFLVAISVLVGIHEFGHFWVARRFGIKVNRFSFGFGPILYRWYDKLGTEYAISAIPFGGYVSLLGENKSDVVGTNERFEAFCFKPVFVRLLVAAAGPLANLLFAIVVYWGLWMIGVSTFVPILGHVPKDSVAGLAGLHQGQQIIRVENKKTPDWESVSMAILEHLGDDHMVDITVMDPKDKASHTKRLDVGMVLDTQDKANWIESLGLVPMDPAPPVIHHVVPDLPAFKAGLKSGDRIVSADGHPMDSRSDVVRYIQSKPDQTIHLMIERDQKKLAIVFKTSTKIDNTETIGFIGVEFEPLKEIPPSFMQVQRLKPLAALEKAFQQTVDYSLLTLSVFKKMVLGKVSLQYVSGPLTIAKYAGESVVIGFKEFFGFLSIISISIGILNLLPIPMLDGGRIVYCVYEILTGRRVSETVEQVSQWVGGVILVGLMILAVYNDLIHFLR